MPSSRSVRKTRIAISPRLATRTFSNMSGPYSPRRGPDGGRQAHRRARRVGATRGRALPWDLPEPRLLGDGGLLRRDDHRLVRREARPAGGSYLLRRLAPRPDRRQGARARGAGDADRAGSRAGLDG